MEFIESYLAETLAAFAAFAADPARRDVVAAMARVIGERFRAGGKLLICGNGGSAADAQHIAGEFIGRLMYDRAPVGAIALTTDGSVLTATGNDYGYEQVFARQVLGLGQAGDVLLAISTSGRSANVIAALAAARQRSVIALGLTGAAPAAMGPLCAHLLTVPSASTPIVQQVHITAAHMICALVERELFPPG